MEMPEEEAAGKVVAYHPVPPSFQVSREKEENISRPRRYVISVRPLKAGWWTRTFKATLHDIFGFRNHGFLEKTGGDVVLAHMVQVTWNKNHHVQPYFDKHTWEKMQRHTAQSPQKKPTDVGCMHTGSTQARNSKDQQVERSDINHSNTTSAASQTDGNDLESDGDDAKIENSVPAWLHQQEWWDGKEQITEHREKSLWSAFKGLFKRG
eukprot:GHVT01097579.1.p1 GENE.GHVT01097579.1~~GHVT01097579.1.p1  ORF type:complete len:209 (-),score=22.56 GHVT01097579.1:38-664(-)